MISLILVAIAASTAGFSRYLHERNTDQGMRTAANLAIAQERHITLTIRAVDIILESIAEEFGAHQELLADPGTSELLRQRLQSIPELADLAIFDADGQALHLARYREKSPHSIDVSDREFFWLSAISAPRGFSSARPSAVASMGSGLFPSAARSSPMASLRV